MQPIHDAALDRAIDRIRAAAAAGTRLAMRGGGSKSFDAAAPQGETLATAELAGIVDYEPSELVVTVRAGTPLATLEAALAERGQSLPFEPPHFRHAADAGPATVGGMVSAGLAGPARASVGGVREYMLGATIVNGRAQLLTFGGQVMKNVAGYDLSRALVAARGTLGLVAEVSLKVLPVAPAEATLKFDCSQADALDWLNAWGGQPLPLNASCWVDDGNAPTLYLRLRGAAAAVDAACARLAASHGGAQLDTASAAPDWTLCRDQQLPWFSNALAAGAALWRASVPQTAPVLDVPGAAAPLVEWHGGQRWYMAPAGDTEFGGRLHAAAAAANGYATLFIACHAGGVRSGGQFDTNLLTPAIARIHRALRLEFDPHGVFSTGAVHAPD